MPECAVGCKLKSKQPCDKVFTINGEHRITITQHWHRNCIGLPGGAVWEGAVVMSEYIAKKYSDKMKGAKVLELGCGPALVGIVCGKMGAASVITTDHEDLVLGLAQQNVEQNDLSDIVKVEKLSWGELCNDTYDFIIGSEVTYASDDWNQLATTISSGANSKCRVILSEAKRWLDDDVPEPGAEQFFCYLQEKSSKEFPFKLIKPTDVEPVPPDVSQAAMDRWAADGIMIWEMVKQKGGKLKLSKLFKTNKKT